jgi:predicted TPR repeat methyltransferase
MRDSGKRATMQIRDLKEAAREMFIERPHRFFKPLFYRLRYLPQTNFDIGCQFADRQLYRDARMRFRVALWLAPEFTEAWHNIGVCYLQLGEKTKAAEAFRKVLALAPGHEEALYLLATLGRGFLPPQRQPGVMPLAMVQRFFVAVAPRYREMETNNRYAAPQLLEQKSAPFLAAPSGLVVADFGAGIGLASLPWRGKAARLIAVDVTPAMLAEARTMKSGEGKLFDELLQGNLLQPGSIPIPSASLDVALLCNVVQFVGDLRGVLQAISGWLKPGGILVMTVEPYAGEGFGINEKTSRFGHSAHYLKTLAEPLGLQVLLQERIQMYPETSAGLTIFRKG